MTIKTKSSFFYLEAISSSNVFLNFIEPNGLNTELRAELRVGTYTVSQIGAEVQRAMNDVGDNVYTVSVDRSTRLMTISSPGDFDLLVTSGSNSGLSVFGIIGFTSDKSGSNTYSSDVSFGSEYSPQSLLQSYVDALNNVEGIRPKINESASGVIEVITFGQRSFFEMNIRWITDRKRSKNSFVTNNSTAMQETRSFLDFCIRKENLEFIPDVDNKDVFSIVLLESSQASSQGTSYSLREMINQGLDEYYETGILKFRRIQ